MQLDDTRAASDHVVHEKAVAEKNLKALQAQLQVVMKKIEESTIILGEYDAANKRLMSENSNLFSKLEDMLNNVSMLQKIRITLSSQLDDAKRMCDDEAKERQSLLGRFRTLEHEYDGVKEHFDDEQQQKVEAARHLAKLNDDANMWRTKYQSLVLGTWRLNRTHHGGCSAPIQHILCICATMPRLRFVFQHTSRKGVQ